MAVYRVAEKPFEVGQARKHRWKTVLGPQMAATDATWQQRASDYWDLQERLYGVSLSRREVIVDEEAGIVTTLALVEEVYPGERTDEHARVSAMN